MEEIHLINQKGVAWMYVIVILDDSLLIKLPREGNWISEEGRE